MPFTTLDLSKQSGTLGVANGGTGLTSCTSGQFLKFTGSTAIASSTVSAGKVLQVQYGNISSDQSTSSTSFTATPLEDQITPSATSSKILILINGGRGSFASGAAEGVTNLYRQINSGGYSERILMQDDQRNENGGYGKPTASFCFLDSPNTTNAVDYKVYFKTNANTYYFNSGGSNLGITLMEIGA